MNLLALDKKTLALLGGLLALCLMLLLLGISLFWQSSPATQKKTSEPNTLDSLFSSEIRVVDITPETSSLLTPGKQHAFSVTFNKAVRLDSITVSLEENNIPTGGKTPIKLSISQKNQDKTVVITPSTMVTPLTFYLLKIRQKNPDKQLFLGRYQTSSIVPSPIEKNNQTLKDYLPYETATYALSYLEEQNMYVFNFIYNFNDPTEGEKQFENAKQNALLFIKSKGIDPNTVVVDWRYH